MSRLLILKFTKVELKDKKSLTKKLKNQEANLLLCKIFLKLLAKLIQGNLGPILQKFSLTTTHNLYLRQMELQDLKNQGINK